MLKQSLRLEQFLKLCAAALAGAVLALGIASSASAHAALVGTDPEDGAELVEAPAAVSATFSEIMDPDSTEIAVTDSEGETLDLGDPEFDGDTFTQPMLYPGPGEYTVAFRMWSEDGHRVDGTIGFTVETVPAELQLGGAEPEESQPEETGAAAEETTETAETAETADTTEPEAEEDEGNPGASLAAILLGALVVVGGGIAFVKLFGRKNKGA